MSRPRTASPVLDRTFAAVAHPVRRRMLEQLARREHSVSELVALFDISQPAVTKHLNLLEAAGLVAREKVGRRRVCRLRERTLRDSTDWLRGIESLWARRLETLAALMSRTPSAEEVDR